MWSLRGPCRGVIRKTIETIKSVLSVCEEKGRRELLLREDLSAQDEESPLLEAVIRELLVKTQ
jgi:hypothetical protein